ncbi:MAG: ComF family protein [Candidatus Omnitrophica bacterium]|nr:ComF family protein [Candidatus Omnitrophota bacterium]
MPINGIDWIVAVPLNRSKFRERTFNQSEILGVNLSNILGIPLMRNNLVRLKSGEPQISLRYRERQNNIRDSFGLLRPSDVKDKAFLLVDDVFTTGATANECAKVLKKSGAGNITVFTLAKSVSPLPLRGLL